jgi:hypothetical protein
MLVIKAYVANRHREELIDELHIQRKECLDEALQKYEYVIRHPEGYEKYPIYHLRDLGWRPLVAMAIEVIERIEPDLAH